MRVMSRNPPAASRSRAACSAAPSAARPIKLAAARCGTWLTTATISSWRSGDIATISAPSVPRSPRRRRRSTCATCRGRREDPHCAAEQVGVGAVETLQLAARHRVAADEAGVVDCGAQRALDAADVGDDSRRCLEGLFDGVLGREHGTATNVMSASWSRPTASMHPGRARRRHASSTTSSPLTCQPRERRPRAIEPPISPSPTTFARFIATERTERGRFARPAGWRRRRRPAGGPRRW